MEQGSSAFTLTDLLASIPSGLRARPPLPVSGSYRGSSQGPPLLHYLHGLPNETPAAWAGRGLCSRKGSQASCCQELQFLESALALRGEGTLPGTCWPLQGERLRGQAVTSRRGRGCGGLSLGPCL